MAEAFYQNVPSKLIRYLIFMFSRALVDTKLNTRESVYNDSDILQSTCCTVNDFRLLGSLHPSVSRDEVFLGFITVTRSSCRR